MQIFVSGSLAYDRIMDFPGRFADHILPHKIHILNVCFTVNGLKEQLGGTAGNIAYNLALLGESPMILAAAGKDFGPYSQWLARHGLSLDGVACVEDEFTAGAFITTDIGDNQITGFNPGAMKHPSQYRFNGMNPGDSLAIVAPGNVEDMIAYSRIYRDRGVAYICDPGQQIPVVPSDALLEMILGSKMLISNDYELDLILRSTGMGLDQLLAGIGTLVTTLGEHGSVVRTRRGEWRIPSVRVEAVLDPTGAGDAYRAGLIKGIVLGKSLTEACRMGATCAGFAVEHYGTQEHTFTQAEFWSRYHTCFG